MQTKNTTGIDCYDIQNILGAQQLVSEPKPSEAGHNCEQKRPS